MDTFAAVPSDAEGFAGLVRDFAEIAAVVENDSVLVRLHVVFGLFARVKQLILSVFVLSERHSPTSRWCCYGL